MRTKRHTARLVAVMVLGCAAWAAASQWNDKTILTFSEPIMVPGATLQPGTYVFKLMNSSSNRHLVQITTEDGSKTLALTQAVPMKRSDPNGDVAVKFSPTAAGVPPALKGWFYPGSLYGHQFVYSEAEAKDIAQRTKTLVLSVDVPGSDLEKGTLRTLNPEGMRTEWRADTATEREWDQWRRTRPATAAVASGGARSDERREATAPMVRGDFDGTRVKLNDLEEHTQKYLNKTISVDAEIEEVFGPRLFTIDEAYWADLDGEILVYVPTTLAALVREDDRVTISGTLKPFVRAEVEREWGWLGMDPAIELEFSKKPVLVASRIVGGNNDLAMVIDVNKGAAMAGDNAAKGSPLTDAGMVGQGDEELVGRRVDLNGVTIESVAKDGGFFVKAQGKTFFVLPSDHKKASARAGDVVSLDGVVLQMPREMETSMNAPMGSNEDIYVYATTVGREAQLSSR